ncbi:MAG: hypothetical protein WD768_00030 [Phycisphaeraceae bacterium]
MAHISNAIARLRRDIAADAPMDQKVRQLAAAQGPGLRERLLLAAVTVRLFLPPILHGNVAIAALRQLSGIDFATSSYCDGPQQTRADVAANAHAVDPHHLLPSDARGGSGRGLGRGLGGLPPSHRIQAQVHFIVHPRTQTIVAGGGG